MSEKPRDPETPDESIPQDPAIPGPGTKDDADWPPESNTATTSADEGFLRDPREAEGGSVSEAIDREPRHRTDDDPNSGR